MPYLETLKHRHYEQTYARLKAELPSLADNEHAEAITLREDFLTGHEIDRSNALPSVKSILNRGVGLGKNSPEDPSYASNSPYRIPASLIHDYLEGRVLLSTFPGSSNFINPP